MSISLLLVRRVDQTTPHVVATAGRVGSTGKVCLATPPKSFFARTTMESTEKPVGPASYFPSIEKKYGQPVEYWFAILRSAGNFKHMELVSLLKSEHDLGHGHANALVAYHLAKG
jgi:hypothetical protein